MQIHSVNRDRLIAAFLDLVAINSPSLHETAMAARVIEEMRALGAEQISTDGADAALGGEMGNIVATFPGTAPGPTLLFCAHIDTVQPTEGIVIMRENGRIRTDGSTILGADDKAGVAAVLEMLRVLKETNAPHPPLEIVFTVAEEIGVMGAEVMDYALLAAEYGFVPDSHGAVGAIVTGAPAQKHLKVVIRGKAAHAGMAPEQGVSAITIAAHAIASMRLGRIDEETTANIGVIHGGQATNIIADLVEIAAEARSRDPRKLDAQVQQMANAFTETARAAGGAAEVNVSDVYPAFTIAPDAPPTRLAADALADLNILPTITASGGGSDANFLNAHHIPTVILSAGYEHPHTPEEYLEEEQLVLLAAWMLAIVRRAAT